MVFGARNSVKKAQRYSAIHCTMLKIGHFAINQIPLSANKFVQ